MIRFRSSTNPLRPHPQTAVASASSLNTKKGLWRKTKKSRSFFRFVIVFIILLSIIFCRHRETVLNFDAKNRETKPFAETTEQRQQQPLLPPKLQNEEPQLQNETTTTLYQKQWNQTALHRNKTFPFPAPNSSQIILEPIMGSHRPNQNAVFGVAIGYDLGVIVLFLTSLKQTGFDGDVVLAVSSLEKLAPGVEDYLTTQMDWVVVYAVEMECIKEKRQWWEVCKIRNFFGDLNGNPMDDPVIPRPVATARYELYWAWSLRYDPHVQILLIDVRDVYFRLNPLDGFHSLEGDSGILRLFEINRNFITLRSAGSNKIWIQTAYGTQTLDAIGNKPVLCSGATIGEQIAIEPYLRAMIHQFNVTKCKLRGCDQGFHNYLFYVEKLRDIKGISDVLVYRQVGGVVNYLAVMRHGGSLREQGVLKGDEVVNWDGGLSPVVHQFDRDKELRKIMEGRRKSMMATLNS